jgi:NADH dehydrogenase
VTVLVTGGTGFVGPHVVHALRARDLPVRALVRDRRRGAKLAALGVELVEGDVTDAASLRRAVSGCDAVVHLVAIIAGRPADFERVMAQGTRDLVAAAKDEGVSRFVLMSALGVGARTKDTVPYYRAKWAMEEAVNGSGIDYVIFRPSFIFGRDGGLLPQFVRMAKYLPVTPVVGPGTQRLQPIWVDDVAEYFGEAFRRTEGLNRTFEIGGPDAPTWNELWERLKRVLGARRPTVHIPIGVLRAQAALLELLPKPPVTRDQLTMLQLGDNIVTNTDAVDTFGIPLVPLDEQLRRAA